MLSAGCPSLHSTQGKHDLRQLIPWTRIDAYFEVLGFMIKTFTIIKILNVGTQLFNLVDFHSLDLNSNLYCWPYYTFTFFVFHLMAMSSTCYNPFLYGLHNEAFQKEFVAMIPGITTIKQFLLNFGNYTIYILRL